MKFRDVTLLIVLAHSACTPDVPHDVARFDATDLTGSGDASDTPSVRPFAYVLRIVDERDAGLGDVAVLAERRGRSFESTTDADGVARLTLDDASPWTITAATPGRQAWSHLGVDETTAAPPPQTLLPILPFEPSVPFHGAIVGAPPGATIWTTIAGGRITRSSATEFDGIFDPPVADRLDLAYDVQVFASAVDSNNQLVDVASVAFHRTSEPQEVTLTFSATPPAIARASLTVSFPQSGVLTDRNAVPAFYGNALAGIIPILGPIGWSDVFPPYRGRGEVDSQFPLGDLAPLALQVQGVAVNRQSEIFNVMFDARAGEQHYDLPTIEEFSLDGDSLDGVQFSASPLDGDLVAFQFVSDEWATGLWTGIFAHAERGVYARLPHLPSSVPLASIAATNAGTVMFFAGWGPFDPEHPLATLRRFGMNVNRSVSTEGR